MDAKADRREPRPRRLTLLDVMIFVASTALGLAGARAIYPSMDLPEVDRPKWLFEGPPTVLVASWSLALLVLRAIPPRPPRRRVVRQPGWLACASSLSAIALGLACHGAFNAVHSESQEGMWAIERLWSEGVQLTPAFVTGAWVGLVLTGRWSNERSWIDRSGRLLGAYWLASFAQALLLPIQSYFLPKL
jgi:hypothetical protein